MMKIIAYVREEKLRRMEKNKKKKLDKFIDYFCKIIYVY